MPKLKRTIRVRRKSRPAKRRRIGMKRAPARKGARRSRGRMYGAKRPLRIQRATHVPKSVVISFVTDKTFHYTPAPLPQAPATTMSTGILQVSCNNIITPMLADVGTWTAQEGAAGDTVEGLDDWIQHVPGGVDGTGRYQTYCVLGAKIDVSSAASSDNTAVTVNNYCVGIHKNSNDLTDVTSSTQLPTIAKFPYTRIRNCTGAVNGSGTENTAQGCRLSDTYSAKKWEGVTDVKDNSQLHSTVEGDPKELKAPAIGGKWQIFVASREPKSILKQVPSQLIRVKVQYTVLLTDPVTSNNDPMITA
jgi:hypothetical protein